MDDLAMEIVCIRETESFDTEYSAFFLPILHRGKEGIGSQGRKAAVANTGSS